MAGEVTDQPGFWSSLGDNGYTRGWKAAVDSVLLPVERMVVRDPGDLQAAAAAATAARLANEMKKPGMYAGSQRAKEFEAITGNSYDLGQESLYALPGGYRKGLQEELADAFDSMTPQTARQVLAWAQRNPVARRAITPVGSALQLGVANPAAAYAIPAAGAGLAVWGAHDVLLAQQQAEKESQLPLS